ncbi:hypothetical protein B0O80DRAFT_525041 [Mortierella sp. GBAus27b]|nr:hypothetical protein B0O80DRAFT_525041 [Mortierella sp. GBAus27b]
MPLFKSNKNKSASAASTPAQTPRSSMQETRPKATAMTPEEALQKSSLTFNSKHIMPLFKSNKNKSASAATTPAQTPRTSMQEQRPEQLEATKMTREQALETLMQKSMWNVATGPYIR